MNGLHAVVVAPVLVRIEMVRTGRTYELLITQHRPGEPLDGKRPALETKVLFRGIHGRLELDLAGKDKNQAGNVVPTFYSLAGEEVPIPKRFRAAIQAITKAVNCIGCSHCHFVRPPMAAVTSPIVLPNGEHKFAADGSAAADHEGGASGSTLGAG